MKEQLRRLYQSGIIGVDELLAAVKKTSATLEDIVDIVGHESAASLIKTAKIAEISQACNAAIIAGIDVEIGDRVDHFNLSLEDQSNINNLFRVVELGGTEFPYQADDGTCTVYSAAEIAQIYMAAQTAITSQTAYHNALKGYVNSMTETEDITAVQYGMELPEPYASELAGKLSVAQSQVQAIMQRLGGAGGQN